MKTNRLWASAYVLFYAMAATAQSSSNAPAPIVAASPKKAAAEDTYHDMLESISALNKEAGAPLIAVVTSFYQLPLPVPGGAAHIDSRNVFDKPYAAYRMQSLASNEFEVLPMPSRQATVLKRTTDLLKRAGVNLLILDKSTIKKLVTEERSSLASQSIANFGGTLPKSVSYLLTVQKGFDGDQPFFVGRVIKVNDGGALYALWKEPETVVYSVQPLYLGLIQEALKRMARGDGSSK